MATEKYLNNYAEIEAKLASTLTLDTSFSHCLVIPACHEKADFFQRILSSFASTKLLLILVINQPDTADKNTSKANQKLFEEISNNGKTGAQNEALHLVRHRNSQIQSLVVDRFSLSPIPEKQGVGLARKIGCDIALQLINSGHIQSPWIYSTDADAHLPPDYFDHLHNQQGAAAIFDFSHTNDNSETGRATALYEKHLRYFRAGLDYAASPYAFFSLGSTLSIHATHYARVRGFPKRNGAEDFYLLNKLAKTGEIIFVPEIKIQLEARLSDRVPFGTGPAVSKIIELENMEEEYKDYHPDIFREVKLLLASLPALYRQEPVEFSPALQSAMEALDFSKGLEHSREQGNTLPSFINHMHQWLDAFRTLKLIHLLRDKGYGDIPQQNIEKLCPFAWQG